MTSDKPSNTTLRGKATAFAASASVAALLSGAAAAQDIRYANPQSDANAVSIGMAAYIEAVNASSDLNLRRFGAALLGQGEVAPGLRDGIVGIGFVVTGYLPVEFSEMNLMANLSMLVTSGTPTDNIVAVASGAMMEYVLFNCPECLQQIAGQNMVFLSSGATNPYDLLCRGSVTTLADMPGRRFRSGAANFTRWAESVGATVVSMDSTEVFDAMSQGVLDCNMLSLGDIISNGLLDIVETALLGVPGGVYSGFATNAVNLDTWRSLTNEQRGVLIEASAGLVADIVIAQQQNLADATAAAIDAGITVQQADESTMAATEAFVQRDLEVITEQFTTRYGTAAAAAKIELSAELIERWKGLTEGIGTDRDALVALFQREIFSRLDPSTYAMN